MAFLIADSYGKSAVRLTKVVRRGDMHELMEMSVAIDLQGEFTRCYTHGDNSMVIPTDTQKNTVYALAKKHPFDSIEAFAKILAEHFLKEFSHVTSAEVKIEQSIWNRIPHNGKPHDHAFIGGGSEVRNCIAKISRQSATIYGGLDGMTVLKTSNSSFVNYIKDQYTTLKETTDRIFATVVEAIWKYNSPDADFNACYSAIHNAMIDVFAMHQSVAVQQTLFAMGEAALEACSQIEMIRLVMPNQHRLLVNLQPFGMDNPNEIFVPTTEPYGKISGTISRNEKPCH